MQHKYHFIKNYIGNPQPYENIFLHQIGTAYCEADTIIPTHDHLDYFELTIVTKGKGIVTTNGIVSAIQADDIYLSFPYDKHKIQSDKSDPIQYDFLTLSTNNELLSSELTKITVTNQSPEKRIIHNELLKSLLPVTIAEFSNLNRLRSEYLHALFTQILILVIRSFGEQYPQNVRPKQREEFCYQVMEYINSHIETISSLQELSEYFNYDYSYISNVFTKTTKQTLSEYFRFQKLERARMLIRENTLSLTAIAESLNYSSIYAFSKSFKQQYGISPRSYKQKFLNAKKKYF